MNIAKIRLPGPFRTFAVLALMLVAAAWSYAQPSSAPSPSSTDVTAVGGLSAKASFWKDDVQFWINLSNKTTANLSDVHLAEIPKDYELVEVCTLDSGRVRVCRGAAGFEEPKRILAQSLRAGQNLAIFGTLRARSAHKSESLSVLIDWQAQGPGTASSVFAPLGEHQALDSLENAPNWISELLKTLAVPLTIVLVGFLLDHLNKKREERRAEALRIREDARHETERKLVFRSETWKQMLPISHTYAAKYYMPVSTAAERADRAWAEGNHELAFFYFLLMTRRMADTTNEIGGFYFKDIRGEKLAQGCLVKFRSELFGKETDRLSLTMKSSSALLQTTDTFEMYQKKFWSAGKKSMKEPVMQEAWTLFQRWLKSADRPQQARLALRGFYAVLDYEANRPYEYWYDAREAIRLEVDQDTENLLKDIAKQKNLDDSDVREYFTAVKLKK